MDITLVAVMGANGVIGSGSNKPMFVAQHAAFVKQYAQGKPVIMGRKTYQALGGGIPGADNYVLTRNFALSIAAFDNVTTALALDGAFISAFERKMANELVVLGGAATFHAFYPWANRMHITHIRENIEGDRFFPSYPGWRPGLINDRYEQGETQFERIDYRRDDWHYYPNETPEDVNTLIILNAIRTQRGYRPLKTEQHEPPIADHQADGSV
ncbi:putative dihydrofolate reductase [Burkholderia phage FLC6]|nr:putative dihydrofolate reductase [Burkholderia phage FLC6]